MNNKLRFLAACLALALPSAAQTIIPQTGGPERPLIDVESYVIDATIIPERNELLATAEIRFVRLDRGSYATFDLDSRLRVRDVFLVQEAPIPARFRQFTNDSTLEVDLSGLGPFDDPLIRVVYEGILEARAEEFEQVLANISSDSAYFLEEAKWFPVNGILQDPATLDLNLTIPENWQVVSNLSVSREAVFTGTSGLPGEVSVSPGETTDILNPDIPGLSGEIPALPDPDPLPGEISASPGSTTDILNPDIPGLGGEISVQPDTAVEPITVPSPDALEPDPVDAREVDPAFVPPALVRSPSSGSRTEAEEEPLTDLASLSFEVSPELPFDSVVVSLRADTPSYWGSLALGEYEAVTETLTGGGEVEVFALAGAREASVSIGEGAGEYFAFFRDMFGDPSSDSFRIVQVRGANWDARSIPGMLWLPLDEFREDFDPWVLSQHVASQWFPLTFGVEDPVRDAWLAEGLAVFASTFYFEETLPAADALEYVERTLVKALSYEGDVTVANASTLPSGSADYRALAAYRGGFIFRMLGDVMSAELFRAMLDEFPQTFAGSTLSTERLREVASSTAGRDLFFFFDQWLNDAGIPEFTREYTVFRRSVGGYEVVGQIYQDLDLFQMPVEIEVETDGEPEHHEVWVSGPFSDLDLVTERKPRMISIDPNLRLLRMSPDMRIKVHISRGEDLADAGRLNDAIAEYQAAVDLDRLSSHALFRMGEALFELGNLGLAANVFRESINGDLDPTWIEVWAYINLGKIFDARSQRERAITEYQKAINTGDDAYGAQAEAERYVAEPFRPRG